MDVAVADTDMEYGGITPLGLPADSALVDAAVTIAPGGQVVGSGRRSSKLLLPTPFLAHRPNGEVLDDLGLPSSYTRRPPPTTSSTTGHQ